MEPMGKLIRFLSCWQKKGESGESSTHLSSVVFKTTPAA